MTTTFKDSTGKVKQLPTEYPHGTLARYNQRCRCEPCKKAQRLYAAELRARHAIGQANPIVSATRARNHIWRLKKAGVGQVWLHRASGVRLTTIQEIRTGKKRRIRKDTERAILAVTADAGRWVEGSRYLSMIDHMVELGFPKSWIAERVRWKKGSNLRHGRSVGNCLGVGRGERISRRSAEKIEQLYRTLKERGWLTEEHARVVRRDRSRHGPKRTVRKELVA